MQHWQSPWWGLGSGALGGHVQTIWPALFSRASKATDSPPLTHHRERWITPDDDFIDVDWLVKPADDKAPLLILFHGLEGSSSSHYAQAFGYWARQEGWGCVVPHFRGCSGELNLAPRFYHAGDHAEIDWVLKRFAQAHPSAARYAVGISLGGNMLLRWAQEEQSHASLQVKALAAISAPLDLAASGQAIGRGLSKLVYTRMFLNSMRPKALAKLKRFPGLYDEGALLAAKNLYDYDNVVTAPLHGFVDTQDYWAKCSAGTRLGDIQGIPALVLNARNDPFLPESSLPTDTEINRWVKLWQPMQGGHVGFAAGHFPGHVQDLPEAVGAWLKGEA